MITSRIGRQWQTPEMLRLHFNRFNWTIEDFCAATPLKMRPTAMARTIPEWQIGETAKKKIIYENSINSEEVAQKCLLPFEANAALQVSATRNFRHWKLELDADQNALARFSPKNNAIWDWNIYSLTRYLHLIVPFYPETRLIPLSRNAKLFTALPTASFSAGYSQFAT